MVAGIGQPGGNPGENLDKFDQLNEAIRDAGRNYSAKIFVETGNGFDERPILEAIFWERKQNRIGHNQAIVLANDWLVQTRNTGGKLFLVQNILELAAQKLVAQHEINILITTLRLSPDDQSIMTDDLQKLGWTPPSTGKPAPFTGAWAPQGLTPNPADTTPTATATTAPAAPSATPTT